MKITVIGTGYVGLVGGTCFAELGNDVICVDVDKEKIEKLKRKEVPIFEPGLGHLVERNVNEGRLSFTTNIQEAIEKSEIIFIAVGTPMGKDHKADLSFVKQVAKDIGKYMNDYKIVVTKSTVPVGTTNEVEAIIKENQNKAVDFDVVSNPEFLREGRAVYDFMNPDRVIVGVESDKAKEIMTKLYKGVVRTDRPLFFTDIKSSELIKYASNAMLATRISFMNEIAQLCEKVGANVKKIAEGMGLDNRIGPRFLQAGVGYGGSCFPKDVKALIETMKENGVKGEILCAVEDVNDMQKKSLLPKIKKLVPELKSKQVAVWGLAFKPKTDDMREAPALVVINQLLKEGAKVKAFDPEAMENAKQVMPNISYVKTPYEAVEGSDILIVCTEWNEFRNVDFNKVKALMNKSNLIDGRNMYDPQEMKELGFNYISVGRP